MLEALIASRIRRTLLEYLLSHSTDRFYLRGLAKELGLSVTPLRRELKRLEHTGLLTAAPEGNILFYSVNRQAPAFLELQGAGVRASAAAVASAAPVIPVGAIPVGIVTAERAVVPPAPRVRPALLAAGAVGLALLVIIGGLAYLTVTNHQLASSMATVVDARKANAAMVKPGASAAGAMQGGRWRLVPGAFGGFSTGAAEETY